MRTLDKLKWQLITSHAYYGAYNNSSKKTIEASHYLYADKKELLKAIDENRELEVYIEGYIKRIPEELLF